MKLPTVIKLRLPSFLFDSDMFALLKAGENSLLIIDYFQIILLLNQEQNFPT